MTIERAGRALASAAGVSAPLGDQLELVEGYLASQPGVVGNRLRLELAVAQSVRSTSVPPLDLRALLAAAIEGYGAVPPAPISLRLTAEVRGDRLIVEVFGAAGWPPWAPEPAEPAAGAADVHELQRRLRSTLATLEWVHARRQQGVEVDLTESCGLRLSVPLSP